MFTEQMQETREVDRLTLHDIRQFRGVPKEAHLKAPVPNTAPVDSTEVNDVSWPETEKCPPGHNSLSCKPPEKHVDRSSELVRGVRHRAFP